MNIKPLRLMVSATLVAASAISATSFVSSPAAASSGDVVPFGAAVDASAMPTSSMVVKATKDASVLSAKTADTGAHLVLRATAGSAETRRFFADFPVNVPADATDVKATLNVPVAKVSTGGSASLSLGLVPGAAVWSENAITWATQPPATVAGVATAMAGATTSFDVTKAVNDTVARGEDHIGVRLSTTPGSKYTTVEVASRESANPSATLTISYHLCGGIDAKGVPTCPGKVLFGTTSRGAGSALGYKGDMLAAEARYGRRAPVWRSYFRPGSAPLTTAKSDPLSSALLTHIHNGGIAQINYRPADDWSEATGNNAAVNASIDTFADNVKSTGGKVMITINHEPENNVGSGTSCYYKTGVNPVGNSPANYRAMWRYIHGRFAAKGVTNAIWITGSQSYPKFNCLRNELWPGDDVVDWVGFDLYVGTGRAHATANAGIDYMTNWFTTNSAPGRDYASKPYAMTEFGIAGGQSLVIEGYHALRTSLEANRWPNLKMFLIWDSNLNNDPFRTDLTDTNDYDINEQNAFATLATTPALLP